MVYLCRKMLPHKPKPRSGGNLYRDLSKMSWKIAKLTLMVRFCGVRTQIWFPTRGNPILLRSENALHLRSAFLTAPGIGKNYPIKFLIFMCSIRNGIKWACKIDAMANYVDLGTKNEYYAQFVLVLHISYVRIMHELCT